jgi:hypothetical protein
VDEHITKVTHKTFNADNANLLAQTGAVPDKWAEDRNASTEHAGGVLGLEAVRGGEDELLMGDDAGGVAALGASAIGVLASLESGGQGVSTKAIMKEMHMKLCT